MFKYILKRILFFIPTLIVISFLTFGLSKCTPGDPVLNQMPEDMIITPKSYRQIAENQNLHKPAFYIQLTAAAYPDTLYKFIHINKRKALGKLIAQYGNWPSVSDYSLQIDVLRKKLKSQPDGIASEAKAKVLPELDLLDTRYTDKTIQKRLQRIDKAFQKDSTVNSSVKSTFISLLEKYEIVKTKRTRSKLYVPAIYWYGWDNQYHKWFSNFLKGDFGVSKKDGQPIAQKLWPAIKLTLLINALAIFFAYFIAIPIGVYTASRSGSTLDKATSVVLFMLYSLPSFWVATMLIVFVTTPQYGMDWFPTFGLGNLPQDASYWDVFWDKAWHLVLPVFCLTYGALAFISRQMRGAMVAVFKQDYIRTAKAKGLPYKRIIWKHAFRNALFPIITMFASILPAAIAGSIVIEVIFNIPGMGRKAISSIAGEDWPVVYAILMLSSVLTMIGILLSDILYAIVDPRIKLKE